METLRDLLVQRAARLQERPAIRAPEWGTLSWSAWRARVEGIGFALLAEPLVDPVFARSGGAWDWAAEVAAACCGLRWEPGAAPIDPTALGGARFGLDAGRGPYHERERTLRADTPFLPGLTHGELLARLQRLNRELGWDHDTVLAIPLAALAEPAVRGALWSLLFAGGQARLEPAAAYDPEPFRGLLTTEG